MRNLSWVKKLTFMLILMLPAVFLTVLLASEIYLRVTYQPYGDEPVQRRKKFVRDDRIGWRVGHIEGLTNSEGFRNTAEFLEGKVPYRRVMLLGDSILFSYFSREDPGGLTDHLQKLSRIRDERAEYMNVSSPGYSTYQERLLFEEYFTAYKPDTVVVAYCLNDTYPTENPFLNLGPLYEHWQMDESTRLKIDSPKERKPSPLLTVRWLKQMRPRILRVLYRSREHDVSARFYDGNRIPQRQHFIVAEDLKAIAAKVRDGGARFMLIVYPRRQEVEEGKRLKDAAFLAGQLGPDIEYHDLYLVFRGRYEQGYRDYLSEDDVHPNREGERVVAEYLYPLL